MLSKVIGVSRKSVYKTRNQLISGGEGSNLLKLPTICKSMTPIISEIKDIITIFWTNEIRVSLNKKDEMFWKESIRVSSHSSS